MSTEALETLRRAVERAAHRLGELEQERHRLSDELLASKEEVERLRAELQALHARSGSERVELRRLQSYARERQAVRDRLTTMLERLDSIRLAP